ncbi:helix-turn-helix domain-containing protein [Candidatus Micrarchaeota archaeon]|nr:helix-turn-helix domain-containing protein [Candidatus Micrarchaeota archaeon]
MTVSSPEFSVSNSKKRKIDERKLYQIVHLLFNERLSPREIAKQLGVSHMTIYRAMANTDFMLKVNK